MALASQTPVRIGPKPWLAPLMVAMLVIGLLWIVVFYLTAGTGTSIPLMSSLSNLANVAIGFGFIGVGGTLGSVTGSAATAELAARLGTANLLLVSGALLEIAVLAVVWLYRVKVSGIVVGLPTSPEARRFTRTRS